MSDGSRVDAPAIEIRGLTKVFGSGETAVRALDGVDLEIGRGEMVADPLDQRHEILRSRWAAAASTASTTAS